MQFVYPKFVGGIDKSIKSPYTIVNLESDPRLEYIPKPGRGRCSPQLDAYNKFAHIGQRKLLLDEVWHLAAKLSSKSEIATVIYAGAAPSNKAWILHKLFPNVKFLFIDPNPFNIYINGYGDSHTAHPDIGIINTQLDDALIERFYREGVIYLYNDYFTDETAHFCNRLIATRPAGTKVIFWSDIRTNDSEMPSDLDILWNSAMMYNWCRILHADHIMLKFRIPYMESQIDFAKHQGDFDKAPFIQDAIAKSGDFAFVKGEIHMQAWAGRSSTETRLWVEPEDLDTIVIYGREYEQCLFHYNMKQRPLMHKNPYADMIARFDHCGDCALEAHIWHTYKVRINPKFNVLQWVKLVEIFTSRPLSRAGHGKLFPLDNKRNTKMSLNYCSEAAQSFFGTAEVKPKAQYNPKLNFLPRAFQAEFKRIDKPAIALPPRMILNPDTDPKLPYAAIKANRESAEYQKYTKFVHIGQRKLAMAEVHHLTEHLERADEYAIVIYAGSAPTNKHWMEHLMFPNVKFLLVDPAMFNIYIMTYRDSHYKYVDHEHPEKGLDGVGIVYFGNANDNINMRYEVENFDIRYFDGSRVVTMKNKYDSSAPNSDIIGSEGDHSSYIDYFYKSDDCIFINEHYFTNGTAEFCRKLIDGRTGNYAGCKVLFWCDLRTSDLSDNGHPGDLDILWNSAMVYNWLKIMQPHKAMLKFRVPYGNQNRETLDYASHEADFALALKNGNDIVGTYLKTGNLLYPAGEIHTQCWKGFDSGEARLWLDNYNKLVEYDHTDYEQVVSYYNVMERPAMFHENKYANADLGFDNCGDCAIEAYIWDRYRQKHNSEFDIYWWMNWLGEVTTRPLKRGGHGKLIYRKR